MPTWIKPEVRFGDRWCILFFSMRHHTHHASLCSLLAGEGEPHQLDELEAHVRELIVRYRPDLAQCQIYCLCFNHLNNCWEFSVMHGSLARVATGEMAPRVPLIPDEVASNENVAANNGEVTHDQNR